MSAASRRKECGLHKWRIAEGDGLFWRCAKAFLEGCLIRNSAYKEKEFRALP